MLYLLPTIGFAITLYISLHSFSPLLERRGFHNTSYVQHNHYFFESIARMDNVTFKKDLLNNANETLTHLDEDKIDQIIANSQITSIKMSSFKQALFIFKISFFDTCNITLHKLYSTDKDC